MKRINAMQVVRAYLDTGLEPLRGEYANEEGTKVCGLTALAAWSNDEILENLSKQDNLAYYVGEMVFDQLENEGFSSPYLHGFVLGFDRRGDLEGHKLNLDQDYSQGVVDGDAASSFVEDVF